MRWRKKQTDLIKKGQVDKKSKKVIYKELLLLSKEVPECGIPLWEEFEKKYQYIEDYQEFYSISELSELFNTSSETIKRWFRVYSNTLCPLDGESVEIKFLRRFVKKFPAEVVENCEPDLLWFISIL